MSPAAAAIALAAFSLSALLIVGGFFWVFDRAWVAAMAGGRTDDRLLQAKQARQGWWIGVTAIIVLLLALVFVVPSVRDSSLFSWVLGGTRGAWGWGILLLAIAIASAAAEVIMNVRIRRSLSQGLPDPMPNSLSRRWRYTGLALFGIIALIAIVSVLVMAWMLSFGS